MERGQNQRRKRFTRVLRFRPDGQISIYGSDSFFRMVHRRKLIVQHGVRISLRFPAAFFTRTMWSNGFKIPASFSSRREGFSFFFLVSLGAKKPKGEPAAVVTRSAGRRRIAHAER